MNTFSGQILIHHIYIYFILFLQSYRSLFVCFGGGPDWVYENTLCLAELDKWKDSVETQYKLWQERLKIWYKSEAKLEEHRKRWQANERKAKEKPAGHTLSSYFDYTK